MATHDYVIDNASGAAVRSDINNVLAAILSLNSNATAPTTTVAYMLWYDTTANILKQRNAANSGWVSLWSLNAGTGFADWPAATATFAGAVELATAAEALTGTDTVRAVTPAALAGAALFQGKHTIYIPAMAMKANTTNGPALGTTELATNKNMLSTLDFDKDTQESAQFDIAMPKSWNESTFTFQPLWTSASASGGGVVFDCAGVATSHDDPLDVAFGTAITTVSSYTAANDCIVASESAAITVAGTPASGDRVNFRVRRAPGDAADTLAVDAKLLGIRLFLRYDAKDDE